MNGVDLKRSQDSVLLYCLDMIEQLAELVQDAEPHFAAQLRGVAAARVQSAPLAGVPDNDLH